MGIGAIARPAFVTAQFGILELTPAGRNEVRAVYGGFGVFMALALTVALRQPELRAGILLAVAAALGGVALFGPFNLDPAVGRARAGRHRPCPQSAHRSHGLCHGEDAQRRWRGRGRLDRVCSVLTLGVRAVVGGIFSTVKHLPAEASGQLPDLG